GMDRPWRAARAWPAVGRGARRARRCDTRSAGSWIVMPGNGILFCDEDTKERVRDRPGGPVHAAAAVAAARPGRAAGGRRAGAVRLADRADAAVRQARLPVRRRRAARPVCLLRAEDRGPGPAEVRPGVPG